MRLELLWEHFNSRPSLEEKTAYSKISNRWRRSGKFLELLARESWYRAKTKDLYNKSASITYSCLLSLLPLVAIIFVVFNFAGGLKDFEEDTVKPLIRSHFGDASVQIIAFLDTFVANLTVRTMGSVALFMLLVTAIGLLSNIESAFNDIVDARKRRNLFARTINYCGLLILVPIAFAFSMTKSSKILENIQFAQDILANFGILHLFTYLFGICAQIAGFGFLLYALPSRRLSLRALLAGAIFSGFAFEILGYINIFLVSLAIQDSDKQFLFGSSSLIAVLFFYWLRLVWLTLLGGSCIAAATENILPNSLAAQRTNAPIEAIIKCTIIFGEICDSFRSNPNGASISHLRRRTKFSDTDCLIATAWLVREELIVEIDQRTDPLYLPTNKGLEYERKPQLFLDEILFFKETNDDTLRNHGTYSSRRLPEFATHVLESLGVPTKGTHEQSTPPD